MGFLWLRWRHNAEVNHDRAGDVAQKRIKETEEMIHEVRNCSNRIFCIRALANCHRSSEGTELVLYSKVGMGDGRQANNPWLQEFPDPISRVSWDNYVTVSKADAEALGSGKSTMWPNGGLNGSYAKA